MGHVVDAGGRVIGTRSSFLSWRKDRGTHGRCRAIGTADGSQGNSRRPVLCSPDFEASPPPATPGKQDPGGQDWRRSDKPGNLFAAIRTSASVKRDPGHRAAASLSSRTRGNGSRPRNQITDATAIEAVRALSTNLAGVHRPRPSGIAARNAPAIAAVPLDASQQVQFPKQLTLSMRSLRKAPRVKGRAARKPPRPVPAPAAAFPAADHDAHVSLSLSLRSPAIWSSPSGQAQRSCRCSLAECQ